MQILMSAVYDGCEIPFPRGSLVCVLILFGCLACIYQDLLFPFNVCIGNISTAHKLYLVTCQPYFSVSLSFMSSSEVTCQVLGSPKARFNNIPWQNFGFRKLQSFVWNFIHPDGMNFILSRKLPLNFQYKNSIHVNVIHKATKSCKLMKTCLDGCPIKLLKNETPILGVIK